MSSEIFQEIPCLLEVCGVKPFAEPGIAAGQHILPLGCPAQRAQQAGQAHGRPQLQGSRLLIAGYRQRPLEGDLGFGLVAGCQQQKLGAQAVLFGVPPDLLAVEERLLQRVQALLPAARPQEGLGQAGAQQRAQAGITRARQIERQPARAAPPAENETVSDTPVERARLTSVSAPSTPGMALNLV